jgi:hypothetical protein
MKGDARLIMTLSVNHDCDAPIQPRLLTCKNVPCTGPTRGQNYTGKVLCTSHTQYKFMWDLGLVQVLQEQIFPTVLKQELVLFYKYKFMWDVGLVQVLQ